MRCLTPALPDPLLVRQQRIVAIVCTITQAFLLQMTVGQECSIHGLLILLHLTEDIILGMDIVSNEFQIDLASYEVFPDGRDESFKETQSLMYLHVPEEIIEPILSESSTRNEQMDTTDLDTAKPAAHGRNRCWEARKRTSPGNRFRNDSISNPVLLNRGNVSKQTSHVCLCICLP
ncbi:hypothetical protein JTB14_019241 [Gonioctena quinquepunctata]|nr:hypothetical protein JTB14_019241 [Gonioctena quinquepunctata]